MHIVVDLVAADTVVHLHALHNVIIHLRSHLFLCRSGEVGNDQQYKNNSHKNQQLSKAAVQKSVAYGTAGPEIWSVGLVHKLIRLDMIIMY